ncbi:MAG: nucleotidyltransferase family protein [Sulfuricella sp.]|nr:nucleotidyltransferase family protein [Sulfuricella sp.]
MPRIDLPKVKIADFRRQHHIRKLALYGSVLRDDFGADSDVDVLAEFAPEERVGLLRLAGMELELSELVGRRVDLRTPQDLSRYFRQEVLEQADVQYFEG